MRGGILLAVDSNARAPPSRSFSSQSESLLCADHALFARAPLPLAGLRHDGTEVACAAEAALTDDAELQSIGIRRWKFQKALCDAAAAAGIVIKFSKRTELVEPRGDGSGYVDVRFADGTARTARLVIGADGVKSRCARRSWASSPRSSPASRA